MIEKIKMWIFGGLLKKFALGYLVKGYSKLAGKKTQIVVVLTIVVYIAETFGYIPKEIAEQLYLIMGSAGTVAFFQKLKRYQGKIEEIAKQVKEEAEKPK